jgi:hypothetical protein
MTRAVTVLAFLAAALCGPLAVAQETANEPPPMQRVEKALSRLPDEPSLTALERAALRLEIGRAHV